jgi:CheY-like chemotaxis protein
MADARPLRLLCVDDDVRVLETLAALFVRQGYIVATAVDGQQALEIVTTHGAVFDVYITDAAMPRLDGKGFLAAAAAAGCRAHLLVFSASLGATDLEAFQKLGVAEIVKKPDIQRLLAVVREYADAV